MEEDRELQRRILAGDAAALEALIDALTRPLLRVAEAYVGKGGGADDLVQETWEAVLDHLADFEGRSSLRTWITRILVNRAITRRGKDRRFVSLDAETAEQLDPRLSSVGFWTSAPAHAGPEDALLRKEASGWLVAALDGLPPLQRAVVTLRDVEEWSSEEVCNALEVSESNQRVLLHRGRQRLRSVLEESVRGRACDR